MAAQRGRITYTSTQETPQRSPWKAASPWLMATPWLNKVASGSSIDLYLDWNYDSNLPGYKDDRGISQSSSGIVEIRHFLSAVDYRIKVSEVEEAYNTELIVNGTFDADAMWTKTTGWTISQGVASHTSGPWSWLTQDGSGGTIGQVYEITFTVSGLTAGSVAPYFGGVAGTSRSADGTYTEEITALTAGRLSINPSATFVGNVDNVSVKTVNVASDFAAMNALNDEIAKGTAMVWFPDYDARPSDFYTVVGNKRIAPRRLREQYKWAFDFDFRVVPTVQFPSTVPPFVAA